MKIILSVCLVFLFSVGCASPNPKVSLATQTAQDQTGLMKKANLKPEDSTIVRRLKILKALFLEYLDSPPSPGWYYPYNEYPYGRYYPYTSYYPYTNYYPHY